MERTVKLTFGNSAVKLPKHLLEPFRRDKRVKKINAVVSYPEKLEGDSFTITVTPIKEK